jgi:Co/Zn/Cd efflux system component
MDNEKTSSMPTAPAQIAQDLEQDKMTAGQRRVNLIWEFTQGLIAILITIAIIYCALCKIESQALSNAFFLIVSMYFVRTNPQLIGGVGAKPPGQTR